MIIGSPYLLAKAILGKHGIKERLGIMPRRKSNERLFWFHAASVGELKVLAAVIPEIKSRLPQLEIVISTTTATGKRRARQIFGDETFVFLQPLEINSAILRAVESLRPEKLILVETELWPLFINTVADHGVEISLVNARISQKSLRLYRRFMTLIRKTVSRFEHILAQSEDDARRFISLGGSAIAVGNTKFDQVFMESSDIKPAIPPPLDGRLVFVAGSLRRGEDKILTDVIASAAEEDLKVFFVLVPRHLKDLQELRRILSARNIDHYLWTETVLENIDYNFVLVVNSMGDLTNFYKSADLAFVGGSLVNVGGHDPAEPAALGVPVLFGPHMENAATAANLLLDCGAARQVENSDDIVNAIKWALCNRSQLESFGKKGRDAIASAAGVSAKIASIITGIKP
jgi:3-deoxy-D-manno-octulosonic-acid transferase